MMLPLLGLVGIGVGLSLALAPFPWNLAIPFGALAAILSLLFPLGIVAALLALSTTRILWRGGGIAPEELLYSMTFLWLLGTTWLRTMGKGEKDGEVFHSRITLPLLCMGLLGLWGGLSSEW